MIPKKLQEAWNAVIKTKFEDDVVYTAYAVERDKYLGAAKKSDPLEQLKVVMELTRDTVGNNSIVECLSLTQEVGSANLSSPAIGDKDEREVPRDKGLVQEPASDKTVNSRRSKTVGQ